MPRVSEVDLESLPEAVRDALGARRQAYLGEATWEKVAGHCPAALEGISRLMQGGRDHSVVERRYIEIAVVTVSRLNECRNCAGRHSVRLNEQGLGHEAIADILAPDCPGLDTAERLVRDYAVAVSENSAQLRDKLFDDLRE